MTTRDHSNLFVATTLNGGITAGALSITLHDAVTTDLSVPFALTLESGSVTSEEVVLVTALDATRKVCTVTRGYDGTTAKIHANGATANHTAIAADFNDPLVSGAVAGGVLSGTYPNPSFAADMATQAELDTAIAGRQPLFGAQSANALYAGPTSGPAAAPTFRASVKADLPSSVAYEDEANIFVLGPNLFKAGADGNVALAARRHSAGATGNIFEAQDEVGMALAHIAPNGDSYAPAFGAGSDSNPREGISGDPVRYFVDIRETLTSAAGLSRIAGEAVALTFNFDGGGGPPVFGLDYFLTIGDASVSVPSSVFGANGEIDINASVKNNTVTGVAAQVYNFGSGGASAIRGLYAEVGNYAGGVGQVDEIAKIYIGGDYGDSPVLVNYGIFISSQLNSIASMTWALYNDGGDSYHNGDFLFGAAPQGPILIDRTTGTHYRLKVTGGVLGVEVA